MNQYDDRVDAYIAKSADFAKPILNHLRDLIHSAFPEISETIKWGMPFFDYKGPVCHIASFKQHCAFGIWKGALIEDKDDLLEKKESMGQFGRITSLKELPSDEIIIDFLQQAVKLNENEIKKPKPAKAPKAEIAMPDDFAKALSLKPAALQHYNNFSPSQKREYLEWITEAKTDSTRQKRLETSVEWLSEGKKRMWKYER